MPPTFPHSFWFGACSSGQIQYLNTTNELLLVLGWRRARTAKYGKQAQKSSQRNQLYQLQLLLILESLYYWINWLILRVHKPHLPHLTCGFTLQYLFFFPLFFQHEFLGQVLGIRPNEMSRNHVLHVRNTL